MFFYVDEGGPNDGDAISIQINTNHIARVAVRDHDGKHMEYSFFSANGELLGKKSILMSNLDDINDMEQILERG